MLYHRNLKKGRLEQKRFGLTFVEPFAVAGSSGLALVLILSATSESVYPTERV